MFFTDTHAHIHSKPLSSETDRIIKRAIDKNVKRIITIGTKLHDSKAAVKLAEARVGVYAMVGVHPHYAEGFNYSDLGEFESLLNNDKVLAVGEVGLDYYRDRSPRDKQIETFSLMVDMAMGANLPVVIHTREATDDTIAVLDRVLGDSDTPVLFHCFNGDSPLIEWGVKRQSCMYSFAGNATYPKADILHKAIDRLPLDRILIETDCPYLAPIPYRGESNEPSYIVHTAKFIADRKGVEVDEFAKRLEDNFSNFFKKVPANLA